MFRLRKTQIDKTNNGARFDLSVKQLFVVGQQFRNSVFGAETIVLVSLHSLLEEKVDPLGNVVFVDRVVLSTVL